MATATTAASGLTQTQLIEIVRTGVSIQGVAKLRALAALKRRSRRNVVDILLEVVANRQEAPRFRYMAAMGLYEIGGTQASRSLTAAARQADETSAPAIALGLGRVGAADSIRVVERLRDISPRYAKDRVEFAATLLAYRHGLSGHDVKTTRARALQNLGRGRAQTIDSRPARTNEAVRALEAFTDEPLGLDVTSDQAIQLNCEPSTFIWLWTKETAGTGFTSLFEEKGVAGVLCRKHPFENAYALSAIGLATPGQRGIRLTLHRAESGAVLYSGSVSTDGLLVLKARNWPGLAAVDIKGRVQAGRVMVTTAKSAVVVRKAWTPKRPPRTRKASSN
jgi:hypothetical protein